MIVVLPEDLNYLVQVLGQKCQWVNVSKYLEQIQYYFLCPDSILQPFIPELLMWTLH